MSIASMTRLAARPVPEARVSGLVPSPVEVHQTALERITTFIPSEVIGVYVAGLGIFESQDGTPAAVRLAIFWVALALVPVFVWLNARAQAAPPAPSLPGRKIAWLVVFGVVGFVAWAAAIPRTPFDLGGYTGQIGAFAVVLLGLLMPGLAQVVGVAGES